MTIKPVPCLKFRDKTIEQLAADVQEEVDEVKSAISDVNRIVGYITIRDDEERARKAAAAAAIGHLAEELTDVITVCTTFLEIIGYGPDDRDITQIMVNEKNRERGYHDAPTGR